MSLVGQNKILDDHAVHQRENRIRDQLRASGQGCGYSSQPCTDSIRPDTVPEPVVFLL